MAINATPRTLADNLFEDQALYPAHIVTFSSEAGTDHGWHAFDGLRDVTVWRSFNRDASEFAKVECNVPRPADMVVLDRNHNVFGRAIRVRSSENGSTWTNRFAGTVGTGGTTTKEGAWWASFDEVSAPFWQVIFFATGSAITTILTGLTLGKSLRFRNYLSRPVAPDRRRRFFDEVRTPGGVFARADFARHRILDDRVILHDEQEYIDGVAKWVIQAEDGNVPFWWVLDDTNAPADLYQFVSSGTDVAWAFQSAKGRTGRLQAIENVPAPQLIYP